MTTAFIAAVGAFRTYFGRTQSQAGSTSTVGVTAILLCAALPLLSGCCMQYACNAIPANRLPCELTGETRSGKVPVDFTLLRQPPPEHYRLGPKDVLGIFIQDILPIERESLPIVPGNNFQMREYFPPTGTIYAPTVGVPVTVLDDGTLPLPLIPPIKVAGLTIPEVTEEVRRAYVVDRNIIQPGRDRILVSMIKPRVHRVLVIREDSESPTGNVARRGETIVSKRGSAEVIDLQAYENDVLHALLATGGLPGKDAYNAVWILHGSPNDFTATETEIDAGAEPRKVMKRMEATRHIVRVPLRVCEGDPLPFTPQDVVLADGDVVFIESRDTEFFYVGGLMLGAQIPLPRDYDLDVVGAVSLGGGSIGGTPGGPAAVTVNVKSGPGPIIPPSRVIVVRTLPDGEQIRIRVDLAEAMRNPKERLRILPGDVVMLLYKPHETVGNTLLNVLNFNITGIIGNN